MKTLLYILATLVLPFIFTNNLSAQKVEPVETSFQVAGVCDMCKDRIENAALIKGVKFAKWNKEEQSLKVIYKADKTSDLKIQNAVAKAGHDTEQVTALDSDYKKLPDCCAYRDGVKVH